MGKNPSKPPETPVGAVQDSVSINQVAGRVTAVCG